MLLDPKGPARQLPSSALELIKTVNASLRLGQLLCQCREPDFLLEIIQQQVSHIVHAVMLGKEIWY